MRAPNSVAPAAAATADRGEEAVFGDVVVNIENRFPLQWQARVTAGTRSRLNGRVTFVVEHDGEVIAWSATGVPNVVVLLESGRAFIDDDHAMPVVLALAARRSADNAVPGGAP